MVLLDFPIEFKVYIGISAMVLLFSSFLIAFVTNQRKKLVYHKNLHELHEQQQQELAHQNELLEIRIQERTAELMQQKEELQNTLNELKSAQAQLIQSEKMASLGSLTAGIAHEIQNPLNFVNNFSEITTELLDELKDGFYQKLPEPDQEYAKGLLTSAIDNLRKITQHGKRADAIVKGMLQHSRNDKGQREFTNINQLAEEYLRLSYHGMRAKDKSFNAILETHFDPSIDKIQVMPQDIARALLNIFNNAFYAVNEKKKQLGESYQPLITLSTGRSKGKIEITIKDNGTGIPQNVLDKIYHPFFTTKPTGEGTGLGLSLSFDIIKAHGGELKVDTKEGEYAEFVIQLPAIEVKPAVQRV